MCVVPPLLLVFLQIANGTRDAKETTRQEFVDNMYYIMTEWNQKTKSAPYFLSLDNNKIQATADLTRVQNPNNPHQSVSLAPNGARLPLPPYSHDLNRPIEHLFGTAKHMIRCALYTNWAHYKTPANLQSLVFTTFNTLTQLGYAGHVAKDVRGLPTLWETLAMPLGITYRDLKGRVQVGTGGDYPNAIAR
jgi:transposase